jgi:catechol 2,3-dioxygenase-like lactoylglutathione lyase family enzyme
MADDMIPQVDIPLPEISHVAFVVKDLEESMRRFRALLGMEPWFLYHYEPPRLTDTTYCGKAAEYSMRIAITDVEGPIDLTTKFVPGRTLQRVMGWLTALRDRLGFQPGSDSGRKLSSLPNLGSPGLNVELIEPLEGPSTYTEHIDAGGMGIHHIGCFAFDDPRAAVERYEDVGIRIVQSGCFEGLDFWYLDMREELDGVLLEIAADLWAIPEPDGVFPGERS